MNTWISGYWYKDKDGKYYRWDRRRIGDTNLIYYRHEKMWYIKYSNERRKFKKMILWD